MVLIQTVTVEAINTALIALQRSKDIVIGGEKGNTINNITISNQGGSGGGVDYSPQINALDNRVTTLEKTSEDLQKETENLQTEDVRINERIDALASFGIEDLEFDPEQRLLTLETTEDSFEVVIPSEPVTLSLDGNTLIFQTDSQTATVTLPFIPLSQKGVAGGVATLDESGRVPYSQLPESAMEFKGEWDASTNTPTLADGVGTNGDFYVVTVGGTVNFGTQAQPRNITFYPNDRVIYEGDNVNEWFRLPAGQVISVNGMSGVVTLTANDINYDNNTTIKQKIDAIDVQSDWTQINTGAKDYIKHKIPIWIHNGTPQYRGPVDVVQDGNMQAVTSNAVYDALQNVQTDIPVYPTKADVEADLANLEVGQFALTEEGELFSTTDTVASGNMHPVTSNAVSNALSYSTTEQLTGGKWIDGKPIYRKVLKITSGFSTTMYVNPQIQNLDKFISVNGLMKRSNLDLYNPLVNNYSGWECYFYDYFSYQMTIKPSANQVNSGIAEIIIIMEYTKTTD